MSPQPLDVPCACGTLKKPVSSIGSVGSLVVYNFAAQALLGSWHSDQSAVLIYQVRLVHKYVNLPRKREF